MTSASNGFVSDSIRTVSSTMVKITKMATATNEDEISLNIRSLNLHHLYQATRQ